MNVDLNKFKGIFIAMYACYNADGELDTGAVKKLARFYAQKKVNGLYVCGTTGEGFLLSVDERNRTIKAVMEEVGGELTVIDHVGAIATKDCVDLAVYAESVGVDAISSVPCVYYKVPEFSIEKHWLSMIESTSLPFIIYNIPQTTGYELSISLFKKMIKNDQVIGIKNSSMNSFLTQQFKRYGGENFVVFNGPDEQYLAGRIMGADAGIGGAYGVMPELFLKMEECFRAGKIQEAQKWQNAVCEIITDMFGLSSFYGAAKQIVKMQGVDIGTTRMPIEGIPLAELPKVAEVFQKISRFVAEARA